MEYTKGLVNSLESDAQSMEKIAPLVVKSSALIQSSGVIDLPGTAYHVLRVYTATNGYTVNIMSYNEYSAAKYDPFHKPDAKNPIGLLRNGNIDIFGTTENIYAVSYTHLTLPTILRV